MLEERVSLTLIPNINSTLSVIFPIAIALLEAPGKALGEREFQSPLSQPWERDLG